MGEFINAMLLTPRPQQVTDGCLPMSQPMQQNNLSSPPQIPQAVQPTHSDDPLWSSPPQIAGKPISVDVRFNLNKVTSVDTAHSTAFVSVGVAFYWTDTRLVGWEQDALPGHLWGPRLWCFNGLQDFASMYQDFVLLDPPSGRMKRYCRYSGTVDNQMHLKDFPFDVDTIDLTFRTASHWRSGDGGQEGDLGKGKSYRIRPISSPVEGKLFQLLWDGALPEFYLLGMSMRIEEKPPTASGQEVTNVHLHFNVSRHSSFYFWKALFPIWLLATLCFASFMFETDDLANRMSTVLTLFLASFTMLYVVGESLPKTDFLTKIDLVIIVTSAVLAGTAGASCAIVAIHRRRGPAVAESANLIASLLLAVCNILANVVILTPPILRKMHSIRQFTESIECTDLTYWPMSRLFSADSTGDTKQRKKLKIA